MIRAELEIETPKEKSVPRRSPKILNERARQGLCVDNGGFVVEVITRRNDKRDVFGDWPLQFGLGDGTLVKRDRRSKGVAGIEGGIQKVCEHSSVDVMNPALCFDFDPPFSGTPKFRGVGILIHGDVLDAGERQIQGVSGNTIHNELRTHGSSHAGVSEHGNDREGISIQHRQAAQEIVIDMKPVNVLLRRDGNGLGRHSHFLRDLQDLQADLHRGHGG